MVLLIMGLLMYFLKTGLLMMGLFMTELLIIKLIMMLFLKIGLLIMGLLMMELPIMKLIILGLCMMGRGPIVGLPTMRVFRMEILTKTLF